MHSTANRAPGQHSISTLHINTHTPQRGPPPSLAHAVVDGGDGREGIQAQSQVKLAAAQVVHDAHVVAARGQMEGGRPATVAVATWQVGESGRFGGGGVVRPCCLIMLSL